MSIFRKTIFWIHLFCGIVAGIVIATMCFTGVVLTFEKEIVAWFDRDVRLVSPSAGAGQTQNASVDQLLGKLKEIKPEAKVSSISLQNNPNEAILLSVSKTENYYANPYTGDVKPQSANTTRSVMEWMINCHRWLGAEGESRPTGKAITGACNLAFLFLAISGLYLWFPRKWSAQGFRAVMTLNFGLKGKARDWNWHNAIGFWAAPVLIVLTLTASVISYRWASDLVYKVTGTTPPPAPGTPPAPNSQVSITKPSPEAKPLPLSAMIAAVQQKFPGWDQITYRMAGGPRGPGGASAQPKGDRAEKTVSPATTKDETKNKEIAGEPKQRGGEKGDKPQPLIISMRDAELNPEFTMTQVTLNPFTAEILKTESYSDYNTGRKVRTWMRFLHTGEALGIPGKVIAGVGSALGLVLVYTGFALSWRRFVGRNSTPKQMSSAKSPNKEELASATS